ncbi:RNA-directed DNA polymerase (reverse transcriptase)-related family protein [Rhynchospora pubera]|uniref:RNA-directed DNA polymerase (Reverse transcriptase)-related family protein n=1 Tax=Rhynchospora pubera TaxID=906938 RepID=A0AAV8GX29_9POAL|nr:RNA-directed DNA polymerase (reverse transcriptase)-related family protein [Rhynchospora pubera]
MCQAVAVSVPFTISNRLTSPFHILQYADDTLIFCTAKGKAIQTLKLTLTLFSLCSGLKLNLAKSTFVPFNLSPIAIANIEQILLCEHSYLPLTYLGLPLTASRPTRQIFQGLIEKIDKKLAGWKSKLLSRAGRLTLVSSVLSALPIFFMSVFKLPAWVIKEIDKRRRNFLWGKGTDIGTGIPLLAWDRVCLPKDLGGLGVMNLRMMNISLMLKWLWLLVAKPSSQWSTIVHLLISSRNNTAPLTWNTLGFFFWKDLLSLRHIFTIATTAKVADGKKTLFWYANWGAGHQFFFSNSTKPLNPKLTVYKALSNPAAVSPRPWQFHIHLTFSLLHSSLIANCSDSVVWNWNSTGLFSVKSAYHSLVFAGKTRFAGHALWKVKVPPTIKIFSVLLFHNRILTQDALLKRNIPFEEGCALCKQNLLETADHLFCHFSFSVELWNRVRGFFPTQIPSILQDVQTVMVQAFDRHNSNCAIILTTFWALWLERNNRIFKREERGVNSILHWLLMQHSLFEKAC